MPDLTEQTESTPLKFAEQEAAVLALAAMAEAFPHLPPALIQMPHVYPGRLDISLHDTAADWEAWREALRLPAEAVELHHYNGGSWLAAAGAFSGVSVELSGHVIPPVESRPSGQLLEQRHQLGPADAVFVASEYLYCGADLGRDEWPYTCAKRVSHSGPCGPDRDEDAEPQGVEALVRDAMRIVRHELIERPHPAHDTVSQAVEILAERGMVISPEAAEESRLLRQVVALVLIHDAAGEAIDCDRLRQALEGAQIDLTPETDRHFAEWAQQRATEAGGSR